MSEISESKIFDRFGLTQEELHHAEDSKLFHRITLADGTKKFVDTMGLVFVGRFHRLLDPVPSFDIRLAARVIKKLPKSNRFEVTSLDVAAVLELIFGFEALPGSAVIAASRLRVKQISDRAGVTRLGIDRKVFSAMEKVIRKNSIRASIEDFMV